MKKLKHGIQKIIVERTGFSAAYISDILAQKVQLDTWSTAKKLGRATNTDPLLWLDGPHGRLLHQIEQNLQPSPEES